MKVENLMNRPVRTCKADDSLRVAAQLMWDFDCGCVAVVDDEQRAVGMITDRDICMAALTQGRRLDDVRVASAMSWRVISVRPEDSVDTAAERLRANQVRRLPVVDDAGRVVGLLSLADIAREATHEMLWARDEVAPERVAATLAAVSRPRATVECAPTPPHDRTERRPRSHVLSAS